VIRVLVAEDSAVVRQHLVALLEADPAISVVGTAVDGEDAVRRAESLRPDVILCDIHMPKLDGYAAARLIMERAPTPIVMATASGSPSDTRAAFDAIQAGALVLVAKPVGPGDPGAAEAAAELIRTVKLMSEVRVVRRWRTRAEPPPPLERIASHRKPRVIAIGASTGGPAVVADVLRGLPEALDCPVLVVQHITAGFTEAFADWLATTTRRRVELACGGRRAEPGTVYVAPSGEHLGITATGALVQRPRDALNGFFCPSASHLFESVAGAYGPAAVGVVLTGMGRDGADGLARLRAAGGLTIAQDEQSSVVFGMPAAAIAAGAAELVLPPQGIAGALASLLAGRGVQ
jgi:two-component system, chemotaxis family, protein-glutamate methylesterase/glutaminase